MIKRSLIVLSAVAAAAAAQPDHEGDIGVSIVDNRLNTGVIDGGVVVGVQRVFGSEMTLLNHAPFADEPGLFGEPSFPAMNLSFNILNTLLGWDGAAFIDPAGAPMTIEFGPMAVQTPPNPGGFQAGFAIPISPGGFDEHYDFSLPVGISPGIFLLELELAGDIGVEPSRPFWLVFNHDMPEPEHDAAVKWVQANLVPAPASLTLPILAGLALSRRRR